MRTLYKCLILFKSLQGNALLPVSAKTFSSPKQRLTKIWSVTPPTYLWVLAFLFVHTLDLKADDKRPKALMANFGATNYPCNTKMPWVDSSFTGLGSSVVDPASDGLACVGSNTNLANLRNNSLTDFASINFVSGLGGCSSTLSVVDNDAADTYPAGTFAGYRIGTAGLVGVSIGLSITIATYNNGSPVESQVVVSSALGLNSSLLNGDGTATLGFVTTAAFDEIRITYQANVALLFTGTVYHAVVERFCAGPSLACNTQTRMNNPTFPTLIQNSHTGITGGVCVGCSVNEVENAISSSTSDAATIVLTAAVGTTGSIGIKDQVTTYTAGSFAGFDISNPNLVNANLLSGLIIRTYLNGVLRDSSNAATLLSAGSALLSGSGRQIVGIITTLSFDEVRLSVTNLLGVASTTNVYGAIFQSFCQGPALACNVQTGMNNPVFPTFINNAHTGITGTACVSCSVNNTQNVNNSNTGDFGTIILSAALGTTGSIAVKDQLTDYPAGTFAGFDISNPNLINANVLSGIIIRTYLNGVLRDSSTTGSGGTLVSAGSSLLTGGGRQVVGIVTTLSFDEVRISVTNLLGVTSTTNVYGAIFQSFCAGPALPCNIPTALATPTYPVMINGSNTGFTGIACVACSIDSTQNLIDASTTNRATINLTGGVGAIGSISIKEQITNYPAGTFVGFEIENTNLVGVDLLGGITVSTYINGNFVESETGQNDLLSVQTSIITDNGRRVIGFVTTAPFDEVQLSIANTLLVDVGITRVYSVLFESFCPVTLECNTTYYLNNPEFPVIINDERTGVDGVACVGCSVQNTPAVISTDTTDYATIIATVGALSPPSISVENVLGVFPAGSTAGFVIRDINTILQLELFNSITVSTYLDGVPQESESGSGLLDLALLGLLNVSLTGPGDFNIGFRTTLPYDEIQISVGSLASVINIIQVYGAFVDTRGADDGTLNCCPTTAPTLSGNVLSNVCPTTTVNLNSLVTNIPPMSADSTVRWFTNNGATGTPYATPTTAGAGTYYAFFYDTVDSCYGPASGAVTVTINSCPPVITSNGGGSNASISVPENTTAVTTVTATDPENGAVTYSITGGADAAMFSINPTTGVLTFITPKDFENPTDVGGNNVYDVQVTATDPSNATDVQDIAVTVTDVNENGLLSVKVLLQGALFSSPTPGLMRDNLRSGGYIPLKDPYTNSGNPRFVHAGAGALDSTTSAILSMTGTNAIVDWVFIELRSPLDSTVVLETRVALLQRDGDVVSPADGTSPLSIQGTAGNSYFVAVKHRNHLGVMTASEIPITLVGVTVDFTTMSDANVYHRVSPFSYDGHEMITISGFKALWAGNANADTKVKYQGPTNDNATILNQAVNFPGNTLGVFNYDLALGYFSGDLNMDGKVKYQGTGNDPGFMFLNLITNFFLNTLDLYNYDLFTEQIP